MYKKLSSLIAAVIIVFILIPNIAIAAIPFYEGKTIRLIVGTSAGGGFDTNARMIARHMGKHIQGRPTIFVENMTGAGSLIAANYLYKVAKPDGLSIGHVNGIIFLKQLFEQPGIEFDARKFKYIGGSKEFAVVLLTKKSGIKSLDQWKNSKTLIKVGTTGPLSDSMSTTFRILKWVFGLPIDLIEGYKGTSDIRLAMETGELDGVWIMWEFAKIASRSALEKGDMVVVLQQGTPKPFPDLPNVPRVIDLAKTDEERQLVEWGIQRPALFARPFVLPPGTPKERVGILRNAFQETMKDKDFLAETEKAKMSIEPLSGEELEQTVLDLFKLDPALLTKLKEILLK